MQVLVEAGQRQTGLLDVRIGDPPIETAPAGEQLEGKPNRFRARFQ
jgi:hypothetical protein